MDSSLMMSSHTDLKPAKKVFLYKNGVTEAQPKCMVINDRQIRDFSTFLNRATSGLRAPVAVRNIYTPAGGHKVRSLNDLESGRYYVAGGSEHFKKVKYGSETKKYLTQRQQRVSLPPLPSRPLANVIVASARYKRPIEKPCVIHVFRNGDEKYRGARILIPRRMMGSWEYVLEVVTEKSGIITPAKRLCTLDGQVLHSVSELQDGGKYVALEGTRSFQKVAYSATDDKKTSFRAAATVPRTIQRLKKRLPPRPRAAKQTTQEVQESKPPPVPTEVKKHRSIERRKSRPFGGRKNKEGREKAIEDHRADSIFGGSPTRAMSPIKPLEPVESSPVTDPVPDHPSLGPATDDEVMEDLDTSIPAHDSPIKEESNDNVHPVDDTGDVEEVLEEVSDADVIPKPPQVTATEGHHYGIANNQILKELESQPVQNSIDLSLQRNRQPTPTNDNLVSKRSSVVSKPSSSSRASRPQSDDEVHPSQTHNILRTDSRPSLLEEPTTSEGEQAAVHGASGLESRHASTPMLAGNQEETNEEVPERFAHSDETIKQTNQEPENNVPQQLTEEVSEEITIPEQLEPEEPIEEIPKESTDNEDTEVATEVPEELNEEVPEQQVPEEIAEEVPDELKVEEPIEEIPQELPDEPSEEIPQVPTEELPEDPTDEEIPQEPDEEIPQEPDEEIPQEPDEEIPEEVVPEVANSEDVVPNESSESVDAAETSAVSPRPNDSDTVLVVEDSNV